MVYQRSKTFRGACQNSKYLLFDSIFNYFLCRKAFSLIYSRVSKCSENLFKQKFPPENHENHRFAKAFQPYFAYIIIMHKKYIKFTFYTLRLVPKWLEINNLAPDISSFATRKAKFLPVFIYRKPI
jgi:hypothetical protein